MHFHEGVGNETDSFNNRNFWSNISFWISPQSCCLRNQHYCQDSFITTSERIKLMHLWIQDILNEGIISMGKLGIHRKPSDALTKNVQAAIVGRIIVQFVQKFKVVSGISAFTCRSRQKDQWSQRQVEQISSASCPSKSISSNPWSSITPKTFKSKGPDLYVSWAISKALKDSFEQTSTNIVRCSHVHLERVLFVQDTSEFKQSISGFELNRSVAITWVEINPRVVEIDENQSLVSGGSSSG